MLLVIFGAIQVGMAQKKKTAVKGKGSTTTNHNTQRNEPKKTNIAQAYKDGDIQINAGIGLFSVGIPIQAGVDYFLTQDISAGLEGSYEELNENFFASKYKSTVIGIGANGNYHFNRIMKIPNKWDIYAGVSVAYFNWSFDQDYLGPNSSGVGFGGQLGGRYFFTKSFGANVELGGGSSTSGVKIGISYKL